MGRTGWCIASFNVENLFQRPKALSRSGADWVLAAHSELTALLQRSSYEGLAKRIVELLGALGVLEDDDGPDVVLRVIRGRLLDRSSPPVVVVAAGRADWIGWVELKTEPVNDLAVHHTAMVIAEVDADVLGVVEVDSRTTLCRFNDIALAGVDARYDQAMLIDGNDDRGIDVGLLTRGAYPLVGMRSHVFDVDDQGPVFSRDCCEYRLALGDHELVVLVNHFKSKRPSDGDPYGNLQRTRQAARTATIYRELRSRGHDLVAVIGDLNDHPTSPPLAPLRETDLRDISEHPKFDWGPRRGTFGDGDEDEKIDYVLLSPALFGRAQGGGVCRKGVWRDPGTEDPWDIYSSLTEELHAASDHAAIFADLAL